MAPTVASDGLDIGECEVLALEQERFPGGFGQRVGEAVAKVQSHRVVAFAEPPPGPTGGLRMVRGDRLQLDRRLFEEDIKLVASCGAAATFDDDSRLQELAADMRQREAPTIALSYRSASDSRNRTARTAHVSTIT